jgi:homopolymeric O-antigen transport system ATP-binding protein
MTATVVRGERMSKRYEIGDERHADATLRDAIAERAKGILTSARSALTRADGAAHRRHRTIWALDDVSFEIKAGDVVGIVGRNGAGKSTLLKIISRITEPTSGRLGVNGRVGALLEVGTGFHPELTGRENVFLYGSILGMHRSDIRRRFAEIVEFAEVERFLDTPIKRYSSGMQVRLAFAVAAHLEPDLLLVDEVLAVGDVAFQKKCLGRMGEVAGEGRTVLFVSHNMAVMQALCRRGILLDGGRVAHDGTIREAVSRYLRHLERAMTTDLGERLDRSGWHEVNLTRIRIGGGIDGDGTLVTGAPASFTFELDRFLPSTFCGFVVYDNLGHPVVEFRSSIGGPGDVDTMGASNTFICEIDELPLVPGRYRIDVEIWAQNDLQDGIESAMIFDVEQGVLAGRPVSADEHRGPIAVVHRWTRPVA